VFPRMRMRCFQKRFLPLIPMASTLMLTWAQLLTERRGLVELAILRRFLNRLKQRRARGKWRGGNEVEASSPKKKGKKTGSKLS
jgi:hypothetical protein